MNTLLKTSSFAALVSIIALSGCNKSTDTAETETEAAVPEVEAVAVVVEQGGAATGVIVAESTEAAETTFIASTKVQVITAKVASINIDTREVTLVREDGAQLNVHVSDEAKNLDQVTVGDTVNAKHVQQVTIQLVEGQELAAGVANMGMGAQAKEGEMPARAEVAKTVSVYTVEAINIEDNTFKLKNAEGGIKEFTARDPKKLARASVGDSVVISVTEAFAVEVVKADLAE